MTAQIHDTCFFHDRQWDVLPESHARFFDHESLGIVPSEGYFNTACARNYIAMFKIEGRTLLLDQVDLFSAASPSTIHGVHFGKPTTVGIYHAHEIDFPLNITGSLWLGDELMMDRYIHGGFQPAEHFRLVVELILVAGQVQGILDHTPTEVGLPAIEKPFETPPLDLPR